MTVVGHGDKKEEIKMQSSSCDKIVDAFNCFSFEMQFDFGGGGGCKISRGELIVRKSVFKIYFKI